MNKTAVVIATVLSTLVLLSLAGLVYTVQGSARQAQAQSADPAAQNLPAAQSLPAGVQQREAQYQALIEEANQRLQQAEGAAQANPAPAGPAQAAITPERAAEIAAAAVGRQDVYSIEALPETGGQFHYQVTFSSGDVVQVSTAGQVLGIQSPQTMQASFEDDDHDDDHGGDDHDDDHDNDQQEHEDDDDD